jgi:hypothetical protein
LRSWREGVKVAEAWRQLSVPDICERMIGFSVPQDDTVLVISYQGMHLVRLGHPVSVESDPKYTEYDLYDSKSGVSRYRGREWDIIGLFPGRPLVAGRDGEQLVLDANSLTLSVVVEGVPVWSSGLENFSGDWAAATFSPDGRFIVLGCPYDFDFRVWERVAGAGGNKEGTLALFHEQTATDDRGR